MDDAGIDVLIATSKHNVQYLLGGHRSIFFDYMDAMGISRYLPVLVYPKGRRRRRPISATGSRASRRRTAVLDAREPHQLRRARSTPCRRRSSMCASRASSRASASSWRSCRSMPAAALRSALPRQRDRGRAVRAGAAARDQAPEELALLRKASEHVIESMLAVIAKPRSGHDQAGAGRGAAQGGGQSRPDLRVLPDHGRHQPQPRAVRAALGEGDILSLDSGGNYHGYIGDLCRMAILGEPDAELEDLLGEIEAIQRAAMKPIKAGAMGSGDLRRGRPAGAQVQARTTTCTSWRTAWGS